MITRILVALILALFAPVACANTILADWTFETSQPAATDSTTAGPYAAESGVYGSSSKASGNHAGSATDYSSPAGNGSSHSFSANTWAVGDYWQFQGSSTGYQDITLSFDQTSSNTGPRDFKVR
jgi:hypothetical protein